MQMNETQEKINKLLIETYGKLKSSELSLLCRMFLLPIGGNKEDKIQRLIEQDESKELQILRISRQIIFAKLTEQYIPKKNLETLLLKHNLSKTGNKYELLLHLIENSEFIVYEILAKIKKEDIGEIYRELINEPSLGELSTLNKRIKNWVDVNIREGEPTPDYYQYTMTPRPKTFAYSYNDYEIPANDHPIKNETSTTSPAEESSIEHYSNELTSGEIVGLFAIFGLLFGFGLTLLTNLDNLSSSFGEGNRIFFIILIIILMIMAFSIPFYLRKKFKLKS